MHSLLCHPVLVSTRQNAGSVNSLQDRFSHTCYFTSFIFLSLIAHQRPPLRRGIEKVALKRKQQLKVKVGHCNKMLDVGSVKRNESL